MTLQIVKPHIHVEDANGNPYVGAKLTVYVPGTTTPAAIYADAALSVPLANPLAGPTGSDAAGNFPRAYIAAGAYKLRAETAAGVLIWQEDNIDTGLSAGSGALPIASGGTGGITAAAARSNLDVPSNSELAALALDITGIQSALQNIAAAPQGRLTLTSAAPVLAAGVTAGTSVYYTPYIGNLVPIYDGSSINTASFSELTLTLNSNHVASNIYDVFLFYDSGAVTIGTGPAWNTATAGSGARGAGAGTTELSRAVGGFYTNAFPMTARNGAATYTVGANRATYVGSIFIDGTNGQVSCLLAYGQSRKWGVWNAYNRVPIILKAGDPTATWTYTVNTWRPSNNNAANKITIFCGLAEEMTDSKFIQEAFSSSGSLDTFTGIGWNSTTAPSGTIGVYNFAAQYLSQPANTIAAPFIGIANVTSLEKTESGTAGYAGTEANMALICGWRG